METRIECALHAHDAYLVSFARRMTRNEADARDLVQDTYVHALQAANAADTEPENMRAWLCAVMRNRWFNIVRQHKTRRLVHAELATRPAFDDGLHEARAIQGQFVRAWNTLPPQARSIAEQCLLDGDSQQEVSTRFGITEGSVSTTIHRMRASLRAAMFQEASVA